MATPVSPAELKKTFYRDIDPCIIEAVNLLLKKNYSENRIEITMEDVKNEAAKIKIANGDDRSAEIIIKEWFDSKQFDFEDLYIKAGWKQVWYDKPGFNESHYKSFYIFIPKKIE